MTKSIALPSLGSRWQRFINWLAGGPPNLEKLEKLKGKFWFVRHNVSLIMLLTSLAGGIAPMIVDYLNGIPDPTDLEMVRIRILSTHLVEPHLLVEMPDGSQRGMEWPVAISYHGGFRSYVLADEERQRLPGCQAMVRGMPLRWTINERFRVWELDCPEQNIHIDLDKTIRAHTDPWDLKVFFFVIYLGLYLFIAVIFLRERRGTL